MLFIGTPVSAAPFAIQLGDTRLGLDAPVGERISAEDYAVALVDEIEKPAHRRQRFTLGY